MAFQFSINKTVKQLNNNIHWIAFEIEVDYTFPLIILIFIII